MAEAAAKVKFVEQFGERRRLLLFHGYPQHTMAHIRRPWWRFVRGGVLARADGVKVSWPGRGVRGPRDYAELPAWRFWRGQHELSQELPFRTEADEDAVLIHVDHEFPMPPPPPLPGQVWVIEATGQQCLLTGLGGSGKPFFADQLGGVTPPVWPPPGAVLAYGPSCYGPDVPWGPPDWVWMSP